MGLTPEAHLELADLLERAVTLLRDTATAPVAPVVVQMPPTLVEAVTATDTVEEVPTLPPPYVGPLVYGAGEYGADTYGGPHAR